MKKIALLANYIFINNLLGWILVFLSLAAMYLLFGWLGGGIHNTNAYGCIDGKITMVSTFRPFVSQLGSFVEIVTLFIVPLSLPGFLAGTFFSGFLFQGSIECVIYGSEWRYSWAYLIQVFLVGICIIIQWLLIGAALTKLGKIVKNS